MRSDPEAPNVDLQLYFSPVSYTKTPLSERKLMNPDPFSAFLLSFNACKPQYGDVAKRAYDYVDEWLTKPGRSQ